MTATQNRPTATLADGSGPAESDTSWLLGAIGGRRAILDGGLPPLVFVAVNAVAGAQLSRSSALPVAIGASVAVGLGIVGVRMLRRETLRQALAGLAGLGVAVAFALGSGEARGFFLPGIYVDAAYALVLAGSVLVGRPLVGTIWGLILGSGGRWRNDIRLRRRFAIATLGWSLVYAVRALVQWALYLDDRPGLMAAAKLLLGWPLTAIAVALTLALVRGLTTGGTRTDSTVAA